MRVMHYLNKKWECDMSDDEGGCGGWVIWLIVIIGFNVLSHLFNWGWVLY